MAKKSKRRGPGEGSIYKQEKADIRMAQLKQLFTGMESYMAKMPTERNL